MKDSFILALALAAGRDAARDGKPLADVLDAMTAEVVRTNREIAEDKIRPPHWDRYRQLAAEYPEASA